MRHIKNIAIYILLGLILIAWLSNLETEDQMLDRILGEDIENNISINK